MLLKKIIAGCMIGCLVFALPGCGEGDVREEPLVEKESVEKNKEDSMWANIKVLTSNYPPFTKRDENGKIIGLATEKVRNAMKILKINTPIDMMTWDGAYSLAQTEENVFIYSLVRNDETEDMFKWIAHLKTANVLLYALASNDKIEIKKNADMSNYKISCVNNDSALTDLENISRENGLDLNLSINTSYNIAVKEVFSGNSDAFIILGGEEAVAGICKDIGKDPDELKKVYNISELQSELYFAASLGTPDKLVAEFRKALESNKTNIDLSN